MDPQASLTTAFGLTDRDGLLYQAMSRRGPLPVVSLAENLTISPCSIDLSRGETQFIAEAGREYLLQTCLEKTDLREPATVILDCPPSLGVLSVACLTAADYACVVVQPGGFEVRTLIHLHETVRMLNERVNPEPPSSVQYRPIATPGGPSQKKSVERCLGTGRCWDRFAVTHGCCTPLLPEESTI